MIVWWKYSDKRLDTAMTPLMLEAAGLWGYERQLRLWI